MSPKLATRDALVEWFHGEGMCRPWEDGATCDCAARADRALASGIIRDPATLADRVAEFDSSDDYHQGDYQEPGYYAAIDRVLRLLRGEITDWLSPRTEDPS